MGIFGKRTGELGDFTSPHSPQDIIRVVYSGLSDQLSTNEFKVSAPDIRASIFISRIDLGGITVTAGNSVETYFEFRVDVTATEKGCEGRAYFDRPSGQIRQWMGNAIKMSAGVQIALSQASVRFGKWRTQF